MSETGSQFLERLITAHIVKNADSPTARAAIARLEIGPEGAIYAQVADALRHAGFITSYQENKLRRNRPEELLYGPYIVWDELGQGGMGIVLRAWHKILNRIDALKVIHIERLRDDPILLERFRREAQMLARIEHRNVVRAYFADYDERNDQHYLAMEYVEGLNLNALIEQNKPKRLTLRKACLYLEEAARGLARLHEEGIVHRDVKPSNLILARDGSVKLLDMGLARYADAGKGPDLTVTGQIFGSPQFMSPEQCAGARMIDSRSDIYSLGGTLYYLCTGMSMYESHCQKNAICHLNAHQLKPPPRLRDVRSDVPERLEGIFQKMVAKRTSDRFQTMSEAADALRSLSDSFLALKLSEAKTSVAPKNRRITQEGARAGEEREDNGLRLRMLWRPPGAFLMGSPKNEIDRRDNENQMEVLLTRGCWLGKFPVTQAQWRQVMGTDLQEQAKLGGSRLTIAGEGPNHPMHCVNYEESLEFCRKLTAQERTATRLPWDWEFRLPTEAEWEHACRAGTTTATAFGDRLSAQDANFDGDYPYGEADKGPKLGRTCEVGSYFPNAWGFHDMHGNVYEWCLDWYQSQLFGGVNPVAPAEGALLRSVRGGDWKSSGLYCRSANRGRCGPEDRFNSLGFRVALAPIIR